MDIDEKKLTCRILELAYNKENGLTDFKNLRSLYPDSWFLNEDYDKKIQVLNEALKNNIRLEHTKMYASIVEGVVRK